MIRCSAMRSSSDEETRELTTDLGPSRTFNAAGKVSARKNLQREFRLDTLKSGSGTCPVTSACPTPHGRRRPAWIISAAVTRDKPHPPAHGQFTTAAHPSGRRRAPLTKADARARGQLTTELEPAPHPPQQSPDASPQSTPSPTEPAAASGTYEPPDPSTPAHHRSPPPAQTKLTPDPTPAPPGPTTPAAQPTLTTQDRSPPGRRHHDAADPDGADGAGVGPVSHVKL